MRLMCLQEGVVGFTVFILMKGCYLLERRVWKTKRDYFAATVGWRTRRSNRWWCVGFNSGAKR